MFDPYLIEIWALRPRPGRCRWCGAAIVWVTTRAGLPRPFVPGFAVLGERVDADTGAVFQVVHRDAIHHCDRVLRVRIPAGEPRASDTPAWSGEAGSLSASWSRRNPSVGRAAGTPAPADGLSEGR